VFALVMVPDHRCLLSHMAVLVFDAPLVSQGLELTSQETTQALGLLVYSLVF
jgi:hypothetical protein